MYTGSPEIQKKAARFLEIDKPDAFLVLSLRLILLSVCITQYPKSTYLSFLFIPGILFTGVLLNKYYWLVISSIFSIFCALYGLKYALDNHVHLFAILLITGTITVYLYHDSKDWKSFFGTNTRITLGLIFLFATAGKLLTPEFRDGSFFEYLLFTFPDFKGISSILSGNEKTILAETNKLPNLLLSTKSPATDIYILNSVPGIEMGARFLTYWTILIEGAIALLYLLPSRYRITNYRDIVLILFIITTYPFATVMGFARTLMILAFICSALRYEGTDQFKYPLIYLGIFVFITLFYLRFVEKLINLFIA